jgi:SAM-dependent methyltransferase
VNIFKKVKRKWMNYAPKNWWGDSIDVRFHLITELKKESSKSILEIGCNVGIILSEIDDSNDKFGLDVSEEFIKKAKEVDKKATFLCGSMYDLPFKSGSFDIVVAAHVIPGCDFYVQENEINFLQNRMLSEIYRILNKEGILYLTTPNKEHQAYWGTPKMSYGDLTLLLKPFFNNRIHNFNPIPSFLFFLPKSFMRKIPKKFLKYLFIPSPLLSKIPKIELLLEYLMKNENLRTKGKAFFVKAEKIVS